MPQANFFSWNQRSSIRISDLEPQHRDLLEFIGALAESINEGKSRQAQNLVLLRFIEYATYHFKAEAELIDKYGYREYRIQYDNEQGSLRAELGEMKQRVRRGESLDAKTLLSLQNVLQTHILSDEKYLVRRTERG
jgi:hemerythrin